MNKHNEYEGRRQPASIDGISSGNRELGTPIHRSYQPSHGDATPGLGDSMERAEGFHPSRSGVDQPLGSEEYLADLEAPILLDQPLPQDSKKRRKLLKKQTKHKSRGRKYLRRALTLVAIIIIAGLGALAYKFYDTQRQILAGGGKAPAVCDTSISPELLTKEGDGRVNILLVGVGGPEHSDGPNATDTLLIASIDPVNNTADLLSIPRDLWVRIPTNGSAKINAAYLYGRETAEGDEAEQQRAGLELLDKTLAPIVGVPIHYRALVDFAAFREVVNALGGVDINVPKDLAVSEQLWDEATGKNYKLNVLAGQQHFDGTKALFFSRSRKTSSGGDFDRTERQKLVMIALKEKGITAGTFSNPIRIIQLLESLGENVYTDFDTESIKCLYARMSAIPSSAIKSLDTVTPPNDLLTTANLGGTSVVRPKAGLFNYDDLQAYVRKSFRDGFLAKENASVAVYNATSTDGAATQQADLLKTYGYNVTTVDSAPTLTNPAQTVVVDLGEQDDRYTKHYLGLRYSTTVTDKMPESTGITPPSGTRFVVILGSDVTDSN